MDLLKGGVKKIIPPPLLLLADIAILFIFIFILYLFYIYVYTICIYICFWNKKSRKWTILKERKNMILKEKCQYFMSIVKNDINGYLCLYFIVSEYSIHFFISKKLAFICQFRGGGKTSLAPSPLCSPHPLGQEHINFSSFKILNPFPKQRNPLLRLTIAVLSFGW